MPKEHLIVLKNEDGTAASYKMKGWLRQNPASIPDGLDPTLDTSHKLRSALRHNGWILKDLPGKVLLIKPDDDGDIGYADEIVGEFDDENEEGGEKEILEAEEITFGLERDLQMALRTNIAQLEPGLTIIDGGKERITEAGRIDITARDEKGSTVVIELKAGKASPEAIAQILSYMGSIVETGDPQIRGLLVAGDFHNRVILASRAIPNLQLKRYSFQFSFSDII